MRIKRRFNFILLIFLSIIAFYPETSVSAAPPMTKIEGANSYPSPYQVPALWPRGIGATFPGKLYTPNVVYDKWLAWHADKTDDMKSEIGYLSPTAYKPPDGWEIHSVLRYPVYIIRTYPLSKIDCGGPSAKPERGNCHPFTFSPTKPENKWANIPFVVAKTHWQFYGTEQYYNDGFDYFMFRTAQIRRVGGDGLGGPGSSISYQYDFKIKKKDSGTPTPPVTPPGGGGETEPPPLPPIGDGSSGCQQPDPVPLRYEYEMDLEVTRIDARTVDKGSSTDTDVYVKRHDFSSERNQAKNEFNQYIAKSEGQLADCESKKVTFEADKQKAESDKKAAESEKAKAQADKSQCLAKPPDKKGNKPNCSSFDQAINAATNKINQATAKIEEAKRKIEDAKAFIAQYKKLIQDAKTELSYMQSQESMYARVNPSVDLYFDGNVVSSFTVNLSEGDGPLRYTFPKWNVPNDGEVYAQINENGPYNEFRYQPLKSRNEVSLGYNSRVGNVLYPSHSSNNWKDTGQYIATYETAACPPDMFFKSPSVEGIVRTVNDNGHKREIKERLTTTFTLLPRNEMRAGYGFEYRVQTVYQNFDNEPYPSNATGTKYVEAYKPNVVNYLPYKKESAKSSFNKDGVPALSDEGYRVPLETSNGQSPRYETREWRLQPVAVEEFSGNLFSIRNNDYLNHPKRNQNERVIKTDEQKLSPNFGQPLHRWYLPFEQPDGDYLFKVRAYDAGVNHLNTCQNGKVKVTGAYIGDPNGNNDFIKRSASPNNPFNGGTGWNWKGKESILTGLTEWYRNWLSEPEQVPTSQYIKRVYLTQDKINEIKQYNKTHGHEVKLNDDFDKAVSLPVNK